MKKILITLFICMFAVSLLSCSDASKEMSQEEKDALTYSEVADLLDKYIEKSGKDLQRGSHEYWNYVASIMTDSKWEEIEKDSEYSQYVEEFIDYYWVFNGLWQETGGEYKIDEKTKLPLPLKDKTMKELREKYGAVGHDTVEREEDK